MMLSRKLNNRKIRVNEDTNSIEIEYTIDGVRCFVIFDIYPSIYVLSDSNR